MFTETSSNSIKTSVLGCIATVETDLSHASKAYEENDLLIYNNQLYIATDSITQNAALVINTNIEATTLDEYIKDHGGGTGGGTVLVAKPTVNIGTYTYNGTSQGPTITGYDSSVMYMTGTSASTNAGSFTFTIGLINNNTHVWYDQTTGLVSNQPLEFNWSIVKATPTLTVSSDSITLDDDHTSVAVTITTDSDGELSVSSSDTDIATVNLSGTTLTISTPDYGSGTATVTVSIAATINYNAASVSIAVTGDFVPLVSWNVATDAEITEMINAYYNGALSLQDIQSVWSVGQSRTVSLSAMSATGVSESHRAQNVEMVILDFDHDELTTPINGKTKALITVQTKDSLRDGSHDDYGNSDTERGYMNSSNTNVGGWTSCARRTWCNSVFYNALPSYFKSLIKQVNKLTSAGNKSSTINTDADYVFLLSAPEVFGRYQAEEGNQYPYYSIGANRIKLPYYDSSQSDGNSHWWVRSPDVYYTNYFVEILDRADNTRVSSTLLGISPAMCL